MVNACEIVGAKLALAFHLLFVVNTLANVMQAERKKVYLLQCSDFIQAQRTAYEKMCYFTVVGFRNRIHGHDSECISQTELCSY